MNTNTNNSKAIEESIFLFSFIGGLMAFASAMAVVSTVALIG